MSEDINELQREWRAIVLDKLSSVEKGQNEIKRDIVDIKTSFVRQQALEELRLANKNEINQLSLKIDELTAFKYKIVGIAVGANTIISVIVFLIAEFAGKYFH